VLHSPSPRLPQSYLTAIYAESPTHTLAISMRLCVCVSVCPQDDSRACC